jgi:hypothetical protein
VAKDRGSVLVWAALLVPRDQLGVLIHTGDKVLWRTSRGLPQTLPSWTVDVMSLQRAISLVESPWAALSWPDLLNAALAVLCNNLGASRYICEDGCSSFGESLIVNLCRRILSSINGHVLATSDVRRNQVVVGLHLRDEFGLVDDFLEVLAVLIALDVGFGLSASDIASVEAILALGQKWLGVVSYEHWII